MMEFLPKARRMVVTPEDRHKIARLYGSGVAPTVIAAETGRTVPAVYRILRRSACIFLRTADRDWNCRRANIRNHYR